MARHRQRPGEYGATEGLLHNNPEEVVEALEMLSRLHRGDLTALVPEIHYHHLRGRLPAAVEKAGVNRTPGYPAWYFMTKIEEL